MCAYSASRRIFFGAVYDWAPERRHRFLVRLGLGMVAAFIVIRATNLYGDPQPWQPQLGLLPTLLRVSL